MDFLSMEDNDAIFEKALIYLSEYGVRVQHATVLKILSTVGAHVDLQREMVRFPREQVEQFLDEAPQRFTLAAADTDLDLEFPCASSSFYR
jgi:trimethylamine:corrinoid methyltransferase-like protein